MDDKQKEVGASAEPTGPLPGSTIVPAGAPRAAEDRVSVLPEQPQQPTPAPAVPQPPVEPPSVPEPPKPAPVVLPTPTAPPQSVAPNVPEPIPFPQDAQQRPGATTDPNAIVWTASEFIAHEKSSEWYMAVTGVTAVLALIVFLLVHDLVATGVIIVSGITLGFYGSRQPRQVQYQIDNQGISIGQKYFPYDDFRSFAIADDGAFSSITFMPLKRFAVQATIYFAPEDEDRILETLSDHLPFEDHHIDTIDRLMRRIRF